MKIAILTSGILPVPAVQGGAVENLIDFYLEFNEQHQLHDITVFSVAHPDTKNHKALQSKVNHYHYIDTSSRKARIMRKIREWIQPKGDYYNNHIEYYFERAYRQLRRQHYDCIILENRPGYAKKLAARGQKGIVLHLHNDLLNSNVPYHEILKDSFSGILTVSDFIRNRVSTLVPSDKITTVHNGINLRHFSPKSQSSIHRTDLGFKADDFILVYSGRINKDKGISELIDAMLLLQDEPHIKLLVIGSTFFGNATNDNSFVRSLKEKAKSITEAPSGMIGLETAFALAVTHLVNEAGMSLSDVVSKITINPATLYKFDRGTLSIGKPADITIADVNEKWVVTKDDIKSKSCNTPFLGEELTGRIRYTICDGRIVFKS